jgi:hypothetical protein
MLRRNFLKALALAAVAPALVVHTDPVTAAVNPHQKYIDALELFDNAIAANKSSNDVKVVSAEMDKLYAFLMANFPKPTPGDQNFRKQVRELLEVRSAESLDSRLRHVPPQIAEMMWPVAVCKSLLNEHKVRVAGEYMPAFHEFINDYKWFIIA